MERDDNREREREKKETTKKKERERKINRIVVTLLFGLWPTHILFSLSHTVYINNQQSTNIARANCAYLLDVKVRVQKGGPTLWFYSRTYSRIIILCESREYTTVP